MARREKCPIFLLFGSLGFAVMAESVSPGSGAYVGATATWLSGLLGGRLQSWVNSLFPTPGPDTEEIFRNHNILRLLQDAIGHAVEKTCDEHHYNNGNAPDHLRAAGPLLAEELGNAIGSAGHPLARLREFDITGLLDAFVKNEGNVSLLTAEEWLPALALIPDLTEGEREILAKGLATHFGPALWGCTKKNASADREAYAAIELMYLSEIKQLLLDKTIPPPGFDVSAIEARFATLMGFISEEHHHYFEKTVATIKESEGRVIAHVDRTHDLTARQHDKDMAAHATTQGMIGQVLENQTLDKSRIRAHLAAASEKSFARDLAEADAVKGDWGKREKLTEAAHTAHQQRLSRVDELAEEFAAIETGENASPALTEMLRILDEEGIDQALAFLGSRSARLLQKAVAKADSARTDLQPLLTGAQLAIANGQHETAESLFLKLTSPEIVFWPEARHAYMVYLIWTKGPRQQSHGTLAAAQATYKEAMDQATLLTLQDKGNPQWQRDLSVSQNMLGDIAMAQGDLPAAKAAYTVYHETTKTLAARDPGNTAWQDDRSVSHERLGVIAMAQGDLPAARAAYTARHEITETLAARDPGNKELQRDLAFSHKCLGDIAMAQDDLPAALAAYSAGLEIAETLAAHDPGDTLSQRVLSISHNCLGDIAKAQGDHPAAKAAYSAALEIRKTLAARDPGNTAWQRDLAVSHSKLGDIAMAHGDLPAAQTAYTALYGIAESLAACDPGNTVWQRDLAASHYKLADVAERAGDAAEARAQFRKTRDVFQTLLDGVKHVSPEDMKWFEWIKEKVGDE